MSLVFAKQTYLCAAAAAENCAIRCGRTAALSALERALFDIYEDAVSRAPPKNPKGRTIAMLKAREPGLMNDHGGFGL